MSRNYGIPGRQRRLRPRMLSEGARDLLSGLGWLFIFVTIGFVLFVEFPDGLADLGKYHVGLIAGDRIVTVFN